MRTLIFLLSFLISISGMANTTVVFQPDSGCGKDALVTSLWPDQNRGVHADFIACAWTNQGNPSTVRALLDFDWSVIPAGATVVSATLDLFHYPSPNNIGHSNLTGQATCWLERIVQPWTEMTVTWNNQPATTALNSINVAAPVSMTQNYSFDVTALVTDMLNNPANSFGFMLRQQDETYYRSLLFASSDMSNPALHPKLTVVYDLNLAPSTGCGFTFTIDTTTAPPPPPPPPTPPTPDPVVVFPNVFTPNGDGINDAFYADPAALTGDEFIVYNRWGQMLYRSTNGQPWDGTHDGKPCSDGTYYYVFRYTLHRKLITLTGFVTLIR